MLGFGLLTHEELRYHPSLSGSFSFNIYFIPFLVAMLAVTFFCASIAFNAVYIGSFINSDNVFQLNLSRAQLIIKCLSGCNDI